MLRLPTSILQPGMVLARPITDERGRVLLRQGVPLTPDYITTLKRRGFSSAYINDIDTENIAVEDVLSDEVRRCALSQLTTVFDFIKQVSDQIIAESHQDITLAIKNGNTKSALRADETIFEQLDKVVTSILDDIVNTETLTGLSQIRSYDDAIFGHSIRVTVTALMIGQRLGLDHRELSQLGRGCLLHDIGKVFFLSTAEETTTQVNSPEDRLPALSLTQVQLLREHPRLGYELLQARNPDEMISNQIVLEHHERQNGLGYPRGLYGTNKLQRPRQDRRNIQLISEIATVADMYDIISNKQPGRPVLTPKKITDNMLSLAGSILNREIVKTFLSVLPKLSVGHNIIIRTGQYAGYQGLVTQLNQQQPDAPLVRLLVDPHGKQITPIDVDLAQQASISVEAAIV